jgi:hypothetical protein
MFDSDENEGIGQVYLLGCPVGLALVLVVVLLILVVGGSIMGFSFASPTATPAIEETGPIVVTEASEDTVEAEDEESIVLTEEATDEATDETAEETAETLEVTIEATAETTPES